MTIRVGQRVALAGEVIESYHRVCGNVYDVALDGDERGRVAHDIPESALTPVPDPEPKWRLGDVVRVDGHPCFLTKHGWVRADREAFYSPGMSYLWSEGRVEVVYKSEENDGER